MQMVFKQISELLHMVTITQDNDWQKIKILVYDVIYDVIEYML